MKLKLLFLLFFIIPGMVLTADAHTIDSVGEYRVEIGWMNEPVVSGETNAIELYVSPLKSGLELEEQVFENGIADLKKTIKLQLIYKEDSITLPFSPDHNIPGKYYAFVNPTVSGFYQANVLGDIEGTPISLSMHPPKVGERAYIEFPEPSDLTLTQIIDGHTALIADINDLKDSVKAVEESKQMDIGYVGIVVGVIGIGIAVISLARSRN